MAEPRTSLELRSTISSDGKLTLALEPVTLAAPGPDEVIVRVEASPINPSDLGLLLGPADLATLAAGGTPDRPTLTAAVSPAGLRAMKARLDQSMTVGNEGAGTVVEAGANVAGLLGKKVGMLGGSMYAQYRRIAARDVIPLPDHASAADGASMFVNPLTSLSMVETLRMEGHKALIHTAAASNLGQMLNRICIADGVPLVNIVRSDAQAAILREIGAKYIVDSSAPDFREKLTDAIAETGATLAFDAIGGGRIVNTILHAMEDAINRTATAFSRYGSATWKQVYVYGMLDTSPMELDRGYGLAWGVSGFLVTPFLMKLGMEGAMRLRARVAAELTTTFASHYNRTISLAQALDPEVVSAYAKKATGEKFLIDPSR
ncbi:zinc-binding dehydrogenase [Sphingomonas sp. HITSZ_GF]|uniref:zinc-binding dehydrogenase n=1 Tax=Sphingomonas sp. HITSZ_GF TaxID=3037247 RepID=UPI00240D84EF|nr:zinc-binding dehydrogenase [Sphingomonas sp. HITSZ_GF]MDG2532244.1 zinc-binding dehydrogenase [Sphingomonas sp. HITSZ_GF]